MIADQASNPAHYTCKQDVCRPPSLVKGPLEDAGISDCSYSSGSLGTVSTNGHSGPWA